LTTSLVAVICLFEVLHSALFKRLDLRAKSEVHVCLYFQWPKRSLNRKHPKTLN